MAESCLVGWFPLGAIRFAPGESGRASFIGLAAPEENLEAGYIGWRWSWIHPIELAFSASREDQAEPE